MTIPTLFFPNQNLPSKHKKAVAEECLSLNDIEELLGLPIIGVIPESKDVLTCTNLGTPIITLGDDNPAAGAYSDMVDRFLGEEKDLRFITPEPVSFFKRFFGLKKRLLGGIFSNGRCN